VHKKFNPAPVLGLGYGDLKVIEAHILLAAVANGLPAEPDFQSKCEVV
jgi:hypothetical protein